jgi:hypothetical protein
VRNKDGTIRACDGGDQRVVWPDGPSLGEQVCMDFPIVFSAFVVKRQALQWAKKSLRSCRLASIRWLRRAPYSNSALTTLHRAMSEGLCRRKCCRISEVP